MGILTIIYALALIAFGLIGYTMGDAKSVTALIPAFFGILIGLCGLLYAKEKIRMHVMHVAVLLAFLAMVMHLAVFIMRVTGKMGEKASMNALGPQMMMLTAVASSVYLVFAVRSFVMARRSRK